MRKTSPLVAVLVAAATWFAGPALAAEVNNAYVVSNQQGLGVVRAFDDGQNTVVAFADLDSQSPVLTGADGKTLKYRRVGDYAVLPGIYSEVHVTVAGTSGVVRASQEARTVGTPVGALRLPASASTPASATLPSASRAMTKDPVPHEERPPLPSSGPDRPSDVAKEQPVARPALPAAPPPPPPKPIWSGTPGTDAKKMLVAWAAQAKWHVEWDVEWTYPITVPVSYQTDFIAAVSTHYANYTDRKKTDRPVCITLHRENATVHVYVPLPSNKCEERSETAK